MEQHRNTTATVRAVLQVCMDHGVDTDAVLRGASIDHAVADNIDGEVTLVQMKGFWEAAYAATRDPYLAMHAGQKPNLGAYKALDYMLVNARTVGAGVSRFSDFFRLINTWMTYTIEERGADFRFILQSKIGPVPPPAVEFTFTVLTMRVRSVAGDDWAPSRISFLHAPMADQAPYDAYFRCPVHFGGDEAAMCVARPDWEMKLHGGDDALFGLLSDHAKLLLEARPDPDDIIANARAQITRDLNDGEPDRAKTAESLMMSERTLQRRLADTGVSFSDLVADVRRDMARDYLARPDLSLSEISFLLGFADQSAFSRAFKRWTDETPMSFRRSVQARQA